MNNKLVLVAAFLLFAGTAEAQIVLTPASAKGQCKLTLLGGIPLGSTSASSYSIAVGRDLLTFGTTTITTTFPLQISYDERGILEFNLGWLPHPDMTSNNFTARLNSLNVVSSGTPAGGASLQIDLHNLADLQEDNAITPSDFNGTTGTAIASAAHQFSGTAASFDNIDVTDALREDIFGSGTGQPTTGFILRSTSPFNSGAWVEFGHTAPNIVINLFNPDGGLMGIDGGTIGPSSDTDTDTDTDSDSDSDSDSDEDEHRDDSCGCYIAGSRSSGSLLKTLIESFLP
jgi:hypothetical protein